MLLNDFKSTAKCHFQKIMFSLAVTLTYLKIADAHFLLTKCVYSKQQLRTK